MKKLLRIGTRNSKLALWQANHVKDFLLSHFNDLEIVLKEIVTTGDTNSADNISELNGKNSFVKEIEESLLINEIDVAVHSYKDMPVNIPEGLEIISTSNREDPRDVLISRDQKKISEINPLSSIGTGSARRAEQLNLIRKDLEILPIRGNVDTRVNKVLNGNIDGVILANAGIKRLGLDSYVSEIFPVDVIVPSPLQGFLAIEAREDSDFIELFESFSSEESVLISNYERQFLKDLNLGCEYPAGFCMETDNSKFTFNYFLKGPKEEIKRKEIFDYSDLSKQYSKMIDKLRPII
tara:strand:- start:78 stop:962 length:885 start_codon:yes stop_codon:yes gene_type:complete